MGNEFSGWNRSGARVSGVSVWRQKRGEDYKSYMKRIAEHRELLKKLKKIKKEDTPRKNYKGDRDMKYSPVLSLNYYDEETYNEREEDFVSVLRKNHYFIGSLTGYHSDMAYEVEPSFWFTKEELKKLINNLHSIDENIYLMLFECGDDDDVHDEKLVWEGRIAEFSIDWEDY